MPAAHKLFITPRFGTRSRALVIDSHPTTRNMLASHLRALGVGQIVQCARAWEAAQQVEARGFDVVLCEQRLADGTPGQDLIDDMRRRTLLSLRTVVIMISGDARYDVVADVAESAVDGFIIKPYSPGTLEDRLLRAFVRKTALQQVYDAIEAADYEQALNLCEDRVAYRSPHWTYAARLGAELALRLDRASVASRLFEAVLAVKAVPWARLGIARALHAGGAAGEAVSTLEGLLATEPNYVDAYDVMGKIHAEQGNLGAALKAYQQASQITPASLQRAQRYGIMAFYAGDADEAQAALERAATLGEESAHFDHQALLLLALLRYRRGDAEGLHACRQQLDGAARGGLVSPRLGRLAQVVQALDHTLQGEAGPALAQAQALGDALHAPDFDIEAAVNLLSLLAELQQAGLPAPEATAWVRQAGLRFCVSRHATDMLVTACGTQTAFVAALRATHAEVGETAQRALSEGLAGDHARAVKQLLDSVETSLNAKLLTIAQATLLRYREHITARAELHARCVALQGRCGQPAREEAEGDERPPGGLALGPLKRPAAEPLGVA